MPVRSFASYSKFTLDERIQRYLELLHASIWGGSKSSVSMMMMMLDKDVDQLITEFKSMSSDKQITLLLLHEIANA